MVLGKLKHTASFFLLIAFLSVKVIGLHGFTHFSGDKNATKECTFCEDFLLQSSTPFTGGEVPEFEAFLPVIFPEPCKTYSYHYYNKRISHTFYNKPPPARI